MMLPRRPDTRLCACCLALGLVLGLGLGAAASVPQSAWAQSPAVPGDPIRAMGIETAVAQAAAGLALEPLLQQLAPLAVELAATPQAAGRSPADLASLFAQRMPEIRNRLLDLVLSSNWTQGIASRYRQVVLLEFTSVELQQLQGMMAGQGVQRMFAAAPRGLTEEQIRREFSRQEQQEIAIFLRSPEWNKLRESGARFLNGSLPAVSAQEQQAWLNGLRSVLLEVMN